MTPGYAGRILFVDLETEKWRVEELSQDVEEKFIGGFGVNAYLAWKLSDPQKDALSPESPLILSTGPFTGTIIPGSSRLTTIIKFPQNGAYGAAVAGCRFPMMLKTCGYDHLIVSGKSPRPKVLLITDDGVRMEDAEDLWGMDVFETTDLLLNRHEPCSILPIGPAGENLVGISITLVDKTGTLGSGGLPALMGSKNLKAIVVKQGKRPVEIARKEEFIKLVDKLNQRIMKWPGKEAILSGGIRPTYDQFREDPFIRTPLKYAKDDLNDEEKQRVFQLYQSSRRLLACPSCPIGDKERLEIGGIRTYTCQLKEEIRGGVSEPDRDFYLKVQIQHTGDRLGICLHTFSGLLSLLSALIEKGILSKGDIGLDLKGDGTNQVKLLEMIARREGIGEILADGIPGIVREFGEAAKALAPQLKGRYALWDPRMRSMGTMEFSELTNTRGAHLQSGGSPAYTPGRTLQDFVRHADRMGVPADGVKKVEEEGFNPGRYTKYSEDWFSLFTSLGLCNRAFLNRFYSIGLIKDLFSALTGFDLDARDLIRTAERGWNIMRALNLRAGFKKKDDEPPDIWFVPMEGEAAPWEISDYFGEKITREQVDKYLLDYYDERGWGADGKPTMEKLMDLGLDDVAKALYGK
jgi:aldehyde:ferredoxin oxidoreductase